jgi:hypothetical protein
MVEKEYAYKMGRNWLDRFLDNKKKGHGWTATETEDGNFVVFRPSKRPFAVFDPKEGLVHTTANIMAVQW